MTGPGRLFALFAAFLLATTLARAQGEKQVFWKLVDRNGKVTYADKAPGRDYDGKVTRIEVDLAANRATLVNVGESSSPSQLPLSAPELRRVKADAELARARERLDAARKAREDGKELRPEETRWIGKKGGGARPEPTDDYRVRIRLLDDAVRAAEAELERARNAARMAAID